MAKISARGDREVARWRRKSGSTIVLTEQGRLLSKPTPEHGYILLGSFKKTSDPAARKRLVEKRYPDAESVATR